MAPVQRVPVRTRKELKRKALSSFVGFSSEGFLFSYMIKTNGSEEEANARLTELQLRPYKPESCA